MTVNDETTYQTMDGFGAAITESSAWLFQNRMNETQRMTALSELFSTNSGIGLSYVRLPIGASDFRLADFTCDDMPNGQTDYDLDNFSIARDELWSIPVLQLIRAINTNLQIMATPWSPPAWMKDSEKLYGGSLKTEASEVFARYLTRFVQAYETKGLSISTMSLQNEPLYNPNSYPGSTMSINRQITLGQIVNRLFISNNIDTKLLCFDHNWQDFSYPNAVLSNSLARKCFTGSAFHGYKGSVSDQSRVHNAHPDKGIYFSEITSGTWETDFDENLKWDVSELLIKGTRNWAKTIIKWNIALDPSGGPKISGGCSKCLGVITINNDGTITRNHDYYALAHASRFIQPGAVRISSEDNNYRSPLTTAFKNPDSSIALIALNKEHYKQNFVLKWNGESYSYPIPARSVATFIWDDTTHASVDVWITSGSKAKLLERQNDSTAFSPRTINWKGLDWTVRDYHGAPGSNHWAADCVWIDQDDALHLTMKHRQGIWYCGEIRSVESPQHGKFDWYLQGRPDLLDSNIVAGLFTYYNDKNEIDIEFARAFATGDITNLVYTIQPYGTAGHQHFETITLNGSDNHHAFVWKPQRIEWISRYGTPQAPEGTLISTWAYTGYDVPIDNTEKIFMNLWKFRNPPTDTNHIELVIRDFKYTPYTIGASIVPQTAFTADMQWRINDGSWITGGDAFNFASGTYTIECAEVAGWIEPEPIIITITNNGSAFVSLKYSTWPDPPKTFNLRAFALTNNVILRWPDPRLSGFTNRNVCIRYSTDDYPATQMDGTLLYQGPAKSFLHNPLVPHQSYYYTIWTTHDGTTFVTP